MLPDLPPDSLAAQFARRLHERDQPLPPPPLSQEPAAVAARLGSWLHQAHGVRDARGRQSLTRMLLALMAAPECATSQLGAAAGLGPRAAARTSVRLGTLGLTDSYYRGLVRYHCLTRAAEDALLAVVAPAAAAPVAAAPRPFRPGPPNGAA